MKHFDANIFFFMFIVFIVNFLYIILIFFCYMERVAEKLCPLELILNLF